MSFAQKQPEKVTTPPPQSQHIAPQSVTPEPPTNQASGQHDTKASPPAVPTSAVNQPRKAEESCDSRCQAAEKREQDDLIAQQSIAHANNAMVAIGRVQIGFGFVGLIGLFFTVRYARKAAIAAIATARDGQRSADAAIKAAEMAEKALHNDRAWIIAHGIGEVIHTDEINGIKQKGLGFQVRWKTFGKTPAIKVIISRDLIPCGTGSGPPYFPPPTTITGYGSVIGPGDDGFSEIFWVVGPHAEAMMMRRMKVFLYSRVRYKDIFNPDVDRWSEVCMDVIYEGDKKLADGAMEAQFAVRLTGPQNTIT